jgi:uncharacterized protein YbcI
MKNRPDETGPPPAPRTRGELEAAISQAVIALEKEHTGRGPLETRTSLLDDMVVIRQRGVLTPAETRLAAADARGQYLLKQARHELAELKRPRLGQIVRDLLGVDLVSLHTDLCAATGDRVIVLSLAARPPD